MLGSLGSDHSQRRSPAVDDADESVERIDVTRYLDDMERVLRYSTSVAMRNEALAILRRWQFDTMLTDGACARAARLLREFTKVAPLQTVSR